MNEVFTASAVSVFDHAPIGIFVLDENCVIKRVNPVGQSYLGKNKEAIVNILFGEDRSNRAMMAEILKLIVQLDRFETLWN